MRQTPEVKAPTSGQAIVNRSDLLTPKAKKAQRAKRRTGLFLRPDSPIWQYRIKPPGQRRQTVSTHCRNYEDAKKQANVLEQQARNGTLGQKKVVVPTVKEWATEYFAEYVGTLVDRKGHARRCRLFVEPYGHLHLDEVNSGIIAMWVAQRRQTCPQFKSINGPTDPKRVMNPGTVRTDALAVSAMFKAAVARKYITVNPCNGVELPDPSEKKGKLALEDEPSVLAELTDPEDHRGVRVLIGSGLRSCEFHQITPNDIRTGKIEVRAEIAKYKTARTVSVFPDILAILEAQRIARGLDRHSEEPLWGHRSWNTLYERLQAACDRAGVKPVSLHDLRRTYGTRMASIPTPHKSLMLLMGHANITTTMEIYNDIEEQDVAAVVAKVGSMLAPAKLSEVRRRK